MGLRRETIVAGLFVLVLSAAVLLPAHVFPAIFVSPESSSMTPTLTTTDVVVASPLSTPAEGEIIVYESVEQETLVIHRVVEMTETAAGEPAYITQGDANEITDQESGEPLVTQDRVVASAGATPLTIPYLGVLFEHKAIFLVWTLLFCCLYIGENTGPPTPTDTLELRTLGVILGVIIITAGVTTPLFASTQPVSTSVTNVAPEAAADIVQPGEQATQEFEFATTWFTTHYVTVDGDFTKHTTHETDDSVRVVVENQPQKETGAVTGAFTVYTFPRVLPAAVSDALASLHPALAMMVSCGVLSLAPLAIALALRGQKPRKPRQSITRERKERKQALHQE